MPQVTFNKQWRGNFAGDTIECTFADVERLRKVEHCDITVTMLPGEEDATRLNAEAAEATAQAETVSKQAEAATQVFDTAKKSKRAQAKAQQDIDARDDSADTPKVD